MTTDRYRVALLSDHAEAELWLTPRLRTTNAAWEAGEFSWAEANDFAAWARKTIRPKPPAWLHWTVVPVLVEAVR
jgi:hypothetical protein